ncbi:hypothetical protein HZA43_05105 [Candidatus Peregrinibacteria bacterium]|nr:hypothetical protein [Candidatus Peregrinibacteria bacterium]
MVELTVVISIFLIVLGGASLTFSSFLTRNQLDSYTHQLIQTLRRAQSNALARYKDSDWGVHLDTVDSSYVFFKGASFDSRETAFDETTLLPGSLAFAAIALRGGGTDFVFHKGDGTVAQDGSFQLQEGPSHLFTLTVNAYGRVDVDPLLLSP